MGVSPSTLLTSLSAPQDTPAPPPYSSSDEAKQRRAQSDQAKKDNLSTLFLLADLKRDAFFGDVHYESSIEGDVLLPLDKVVLKGWRSYCGVDDGVEAVGAEIERALGECLDSGVIEALKINISSVVAAALKEVRASTDKNWAERRGFSIAVGHLGGIYRLNYLLHLHRTPFPFDTGLASPDPTVFLLAAYALSSVRTDWLSMNSVNIALEQSFLHVDGESHEEFRKRVGKLKEAALRDWEEDRVREARVERRRRSAGKGEGEVEKSGRSEG